MSDTLYLQLDMNIQVQHPHVYLQDIARLSCTNPKILNRLPCPCLLRTWIQKSREGMSCLSWILST